MHQKVPTSHKQTLYKYLYFITRTNTTVNVETIRLIKQKKSDNQLIVALYIQLLRNSSEKFVKEYHLQLPVGSGFHDFMQAIIPPCQKIYPSSSCFLFALYGLIIPRFEARMKFNIISRSGLWGISCSTSSHPCE